jgi:hypothetical protein
MERPNRGGSVFAHATRIYVGLDRAVAGRNLRGRMADDRPILVPSCQFNFVLGILAYGTLRCPNHTGRGKIAPVNDGRCLHVWVRVAPRVVY